MADDYMATMRSACQMQLDWQASRAWRYQRYFDGEAQIAALLDTGGKADLYHLPG